MPKSSRVLEVVVVGIDGMRGGVARDAGKQGFFAGSVGLSGGAICLFGFGCTDFCGRINGGGIRLDSGSILRMFAVLDKGPGRTDGGHLKVLAGTRAADAFGVIMTSAGAGGTWGSSSRSSNEKSRSCVERGGTLSMICDCRVTAFGNDIVAAVSADSSRAICVPLSRKSSQPSSANRVDAAVCIGS